MTLRHGPQTSLIFAFIVLFLLAAQAEDPPPPVLLANGGYELADKERPEKPLGWDLPDGLGVQWVIEAGRGRVIFMDTTVPERDMEKRWREKGLEQWHIPDAAANAISDTYGLSYYSDPFPAAPGQAYAVSFNWKGASGGAKLWVRGYGVKGGKPRKLYETWIPCRGPNDQWNRMRQAFHPTRRTPGVSELRVMLYAYYPPGRYGFDDIAIVAISPEDYERESRTQAGGE